ncbi:polyphosphate kinase 1 [Paenibacillus alkalitolerans]|uniref:polyphosphate kinase 1 n=1 Tax=Paenibacillus alkalitolerans TaxID=2799335 RepID=UPI0018F75AB9|nr:polyphosphate kinase 1 [Paenibacillus alkalitolerans]
MAKNEEKAARDVSNRYVNRELSWIQFNRRVLEEAQDPEIPLLERIKFLSIVSTNLDEFMSVRVAGIIDQIKAGYQKKDFSGYTPSVLVKRIMKLAEELVDDQYRTYRDVMRQLAKEGICFVHSYDDLNASQQKAMDQFFHEIVFPVLTPMAVDQSRPFPLVHTLGVYLAVVLRREGDDPEDEPYFAIVQVPSILPRYIELPLRLNSKKTEMMLIESVIKRHIRTLFSGYVPVSVHAFRLTRNADLTLNEEGAEDLLEEIEKELRKRRWGSPVRLEVERGMHPFALEMLTGEFEVGDNIFDFDGPLDLSFLMKFSVSLQGYDHLRYRDIKPVYPKEFTADDDEHVDLFPVLAKQDVLVQHPFESFDAVTDFIVQAAHDPKVLAIKITLYRVSGNSVLVQSLARAAEAGKQVTVVVELKARFDEERNIAWARRLEKAGCHVVYGLVGLKTHCKITLVVRQEQGGLQRYVHVGTGNYNDATAKLYTDVGLFTSHPVIGEDASALFNEMTGYSAPRHWKSFGVAPADLRDKLFELIRNEAENAKAGKPAKIIVKINSLSHQEMLDELYAASQAGVRIDLIVRGVCCLRPGVPGLSENIRVISIVDRFLEHSRIFYFENAGDPKVYISSADWMTRNLTRRIELMCPVFDKKLQQSLVNILHLCLEDNVKARELKSNGTYIRLQPDKAAKRSQFSAMTVDNWKVF